MARILVDDGRDNGRTLESIFPGDGEMARRMREYPWRQSSLGDAARWPQSLKTAVGIALGSRQPFWLGWGPELIFLYNDAYQSIIGGKHPWAIGRPFAEVWSEIWDVCGPMSEVVMRGEGSTYVEAQLLIMERHGWQEETYYTFSYSPIFDDDGRIGGLICANTDDTRRVVGERQVATLRELAARTHGAPTVQDACKLAVEALASNSRDAPFVVAYLAESADEPLTARAVSTGAESLADSRHWAPLAHAVQTGEAQCCTVPQALEPPRGAWSRSPLEAAIVPVPFGDGRWRGALVVGLNPFRGFDESYRGFLGLAVRQVSAAIAAAFALEQEKKRAEALAEIDRAKTVFFSNVSHEFRTPLTLMLGPVEDILAKPSQDVLAPNRAALEVVQRNGRRLLKLVNTLLDFARIEAGRAQAAYEPTDLAAFTADLASNFRSACELAGLRLVVDCPSSGEAFVDREMWEKIVLNLLSNAFKFTLQGEISVTLRREGSAFRLIVRDTGTGIAAESLHRMFERFHRVEGAQGRSHEGSGIGLALVQELVKLHGGTIGVESIAGKGSTFSVSIPAGAAHLPAGRIRAERAASSTALRADAFVHEALSWLPDKSPDAAQRTAAHGRHVLLADDNADLREYARRLLAEHYDVEAVADGEAALAAARARKPDLVVTDIMMPKLDGFGLIRALRADEELREVPVIALSARAGEEARIEGLERGADDYLTKPFSSRELLVRCQALLHSQEIRRQALGAVRARERQLAAETEALAKLNAASSRLWRAESLPEGLELMLGAIIELLGADFGNIQLVDGEVLRIAAHRGFRRDFLDFFAEVSATMHDSTCGRALRSGERIVVEDVEADAPFEPLRSIARAAGYRAVQSTPLVTRDGRPLGMISTHWAVPHRPSEQDLRRLDLYARQAGDFIERCEADERLRRSEQALNDFFETASVGLHWVGPDGTILRANSAELELLGYTKEEYVGRHIAEFYADRAVIDDILARLARGERLDERPVQMRCKDGSVRDVLVTSSVLFEQGKFVHTRCFTVDVTARARAERALIARAKQQTAVASLGELALKERNLQEVFDRATASVAETLGVEYCKVLELLPGGTEVLLRAGVGWRPGLVGSARVSTGMDSQAGYTLASGAPVVVRDLRTEKRFRGPSLLTEHGVVSGASCIIRAAGGEPWGVLGMHSTRRIDFSEDDVTFLSTVANVLGQAVERERSEFALRESDRRKDEFIAMLSHELRNPLAPLRNAVELMRLKEPPGSDGRLRAMMERQIGHLVRLVDDLLQASRINRGVLELRRERVKLGEVVRSALEAAQPFVREFAHELNVEVPPEPIWIEADPVRLAQCFANLLNNAARYTPRGGRVSLIVAHGRDERVRISVRDTGPGFTAEKKAAMFEMFARGEGSVGLGIGLALVRKLVEMHDGSVEASSEGEGRGAEFTITLPVSSPPERMPDALPSAPPSGLRIVVADDNHEAAEALAALLRELGNEVRLAFDGVEAVEATRAFHPHVMLLDIGMPKLDGYGVAREIRRDPDAQAVKMVAITGWGQDDDRRRAHEAGFDAHLVKPAELDGLQRVLAEVLSRGHDKSRGSGDLPTDVSERLPN